MKLPNKPIKSATIISKGDPSVGIPCTSFKMETFIDLDCYGGDDQDKCDVLLTMKQLIKDAYECMGCEPSCVVFDYEIENLQEKDSSNED
jgi:hypothetical protein